MIKISIFIAKRNLILPKFELLLIGDGTTILAMKLTKLFYLTIKTLKWI